MSDLISREEAKQAVHNAFVPYQTTWASVINQVNRCIEKLPPVEAVPVVHGEWINEYINPYGHPCHICSVCGFHASHQDKNFCPECGADMRKKV